MIDLSKKFILENTTKFGCEDFRFLMETKYLLLPTYC